jgi:hypothetical protein
MALKIIQIERFMYIVIDNHTYMVVWCEWSDNGNAIGDSCQVDHVDLEEASEQLERLQKIED